ncbi:MAG: TonB-dependent receptor [Dysgonamonadaceae bacterium]|nr:TonB-dependent receptor [Dysgonamonadaceae bacterium]
MKIKYMFLALLCLFINQSFAEEPTKGTDANIFGHVLDKNTQEHLPYVTLQFKGTTTGTATDATGHYFLKNLPIGEFTVQVKMMGYKTIEQPVKTIEGETIEMNFDLEESTIYFEDVVISADRNGNKRRLSPSLVSVLDMKTFDVTNSTTLSDGLKFQPGLRVENNCQNCGFTQVRINGLDGPYSQILIDSRPIIGSLGGVYGLEHIPGNMIEKVEVVRGGGSALMGSSAIGGTINIITKEPLRNSAEFAHTLTNFNSDGAFENNTSFNASMLADSRKAGMMVYGQHRTRDGYDVDGDGFTELPVLKNRSLGFRSFLKTGHYSRITLEYHNMHEFRRGGDQLNRPPHEAYIAEQAEHFINGGGVKFDQSSADGKNKFSLYGSAQHTDRKSYYGGGDPAVGNLPNINPNMTQEEIDITNEAIDNYNNRLISYGRSTELTYQVGGQYSHKFDQFLFMPASLTGGLEYLGSELDDVSGYRIESIRQYSKTATAFAQNEWKNDNWSLLIGGRLDKNNLVENLIFSPRANIRYNPNENINFRLSYSEGFRPPQLFDEDLHVDIAGGEQIVRRLSDDLDAEQSQSISGSIDMYQQIERVNLNVLVEGFYTHLKNPFVEVKTGNEILIQNADDGAKVYGINLEVRVDIASWLNLQAGATFQRSLYSSERKWWEPENEEEKEIDQVVPTHEMMRTPDTYAYFVATWTPVKKFAASLSGNYTGSMLVPHEAGKGVEGVHRFSKVNITEKSPSFFEINTKLSYTFPIYEYIMLELNAGIQNIFNEYQKDFDTGAGRASSYVYGPGAPRSFFSGLKMSF